MIASAGSAASLRAITRRRHSFRRDGGRRSLPHVPVRDVAVGQLDTIYARLLPRRDDYRHRRARRVRPIAGPLVRRISAADALTASIYRQHNDRSRADDANTCRGYDVVEPRTRRR